MFKKITLFFGALLFAGTANAATDFQVASQLLSAAKAGDVQYVQILVNAGADVNYVDSTGLSIVCTALMNNDTRATQILQIYGADASKCDQQIKNYNNKLPKEESGGLFSGLSNAQSIALAAGGAAIVAGGIFGLTKLLDSDGGGGGGSGGEGLCRPGAACQCSNGYTGTCSATGTCVNCTDSSTGSATEWSVGALPVGPAGDYNPDFYSPSDTDDIRYKDFNYFKTAGTQNYLLMMHGYSPLARGYMGMRTLRYADKAPFPLNDISFGGHVAGGGKPIATALITTNGINAAGSAEDGWLVWAECNGAIGASSGCTSAAANSGTVSRKYYNNTINKNSSSDMTDWTVSEDAAFDLSGNGTVFNTGATDAESMLAKIVAGWYADGRADGDYLGFMPNGQLIVYRTGGGAGNTDFHNFKAMYLAANLKQGGNAVSNIVANASPVPGMRHADTMTISDMLALTGTLTGDNKAAKFLDMLNTYYDNPADTTDLVTPGIYAGLLFSGIGTLYTPMIIMSTGDYEIGTGPGKSLSVQEATLENAAPIYYEKLNHSFMSVVAVQLDGTGTSGYTNITDYGSTTSGNNKLHLAAWDAVDDNGTPGDATDDMTHYYGARACGQAGKGTGTLDPWCFAAAGENGEQAVAAAAGAVGAVMGAFSYMSTDQVFTLLALTADGPWLGTIDGTATTADVLKSYLAEKYVLPGEYQFRVDNGESYLSVFAEVFGYGLINLERAVTPGKKVYYFDGTKINSGTPAYWRSASSRSVSGTNFLASSVFGSRNASVSVPYFDEISSTDGSLTIPRVFENNFSFDNGRRGLYMGDLIGEFETEHKATHDAKGIMTFNMSFSNSAKMDDKMGGLDDMSFGFRTDDYKIGARYQRHFTDSKNVIMRGDASNPVLALASHALTSDASVSYGKWSFGASAFSGSVTDETLLENDPVVTNTYEPMRLGWIGGGQSSVGYTGDKFAMNTSFGFLRESDTTLGTYSDGLLNMGGGNTLYIDHVISYAPTDFLSFSARGTIARTTADPSMGVITDLSTIESNALSFGMDAGNFSFMVSRPLAVSRGYLEYATADYKLVDSENGYDLIANPYIAHLDLSSERRETRFSFAYRHRFGDFTTGALGLIYRVHPNHTDQYGNEGIVMFKLNHKLGI